MLQVVFATVLGVTLGPMAPDAPAHQPQMAANRSTVVLVFGAGNAIYFSASHDAGRTFSGAMKVADAPVVPLNRHRGPRVAMSDGTIVVSAVTGKALSQEPHAHGLPSDGDLLAWRSVDGGKTWSKGIVINDVAGAPTEGLHSLTADTVGNFFAVWLDKRGGHGTKLYGAKSADRGRTWSKNVMIYESPDGTICECCHPSVAIDSSGEILVMWRNWLDGARDMYLARSRDGIRFSKPEKLGTGTWQLNACPMDGGGIAIVRNRVVTAWRRDHEIFLASPGGNEWGIGEGMDVAVTAGADGVYAVWITPAGVRALVPGSKEPFAIAPSGAFPNIVVPPNGHPLVAWEDKGQILIHSVP